MPILDISDGNGGLKPGAEYELKAVIAYPSDEPAEVEQRKLLQCLWLYRDYLSPECEKSSKTIPLEIRDLRTLLFLNPLEVHHNYKQQCGMGFVAGRILSNIEFVARTEPGKASVNRAVTQIRFWAGKRTGEMIVAALSDIGFGVESDRKLPWEGQSRTPSMSTSEAKIREYWGDFKSVSHFWAAGVYWHTQNFLGVAKNDPYGFLDHLADAEHLRKFGEGHFARGQEKHNNSTLDPDATWKIPDDLALPESQYAERPPVRAGILIDTDVMKGVKVRKYSK